MSERRVVPACEPVDVVDEDDRVLRTVDRATMRREALLHRAVYLAVVHPDGRRLLVHRRSEDKDLLPGWWDVAVGGVVTAGESWDEAAARELAEEIGVTDAGPEPLGTGCRLYDAPGLRALGRCYRVVTAGPFVFADGEVVEAEWVDFADLAQVLQRRPFVPDSLEVLLPLLPTFPDR